MITAGFKCSVLISPTLFCLTPLVTPVITRYLNIARQFRNRLTGIVTKVTKDRVMAQVELQAGPFHIVSLMSRKAANKLSLKPGSLASASVKPTTVVVELPEH